MSMSIAEAKSQLSSIVERAAAGEEITITKHGKPMARLVPLSATRPLDAHDLMRQMREGRTATIGEGDWKDLRDAGRRF